MQDYDYVIVGAGPAGCVLANKLSADPAVRVALLEAGPEAHHPLISMPKGFGKLLVKSPFVTHYPTEPDSRGNRYVWARGRSVGGSTSVNGMAYSRGQPEDFDAWEARGARGWGWQQMLAAFREIEDHELGADAMRGSGGPLHVGVNRHRTRFTDAVLKAAPNIGLPVREEVNREDQVGIAPMTHMIRDGRRVSAADAFLTPVRGRPNLHVFPNTTAQKLLFEARRCRQVQCVTAQGMRTFTANREIMVCGGAFETPKLLMLSGIGPAAHLREHGIEPIHDSPGVGANMSEHRGIALQYRLKGRISHNPQFSMPRLFGNVVRYFLFRSGVLSYGSHELMGFARVLPESKSADTQLFISPFSRVLGAKTPQFEAHPGAQCLIYPSRPSSRGSVRLRSSNPADFPLITPNALDTDYDRAVTVAMVPYIRRLFATEPVASLLQAETFPGADCRSAEDILEAVRTRGTWGFHTCGTARMGADPEAVVDAQLQVRGVEKLRVVDASVFPNIVSGNTTAAVAAVAWRAADIILGRAV